jgi:hypothetical protein
MAVNWSYFNPPAFGGTTFNADTMLLMTDGSVLVHHAYGKQWYRLTPDMTQADPNNRYKNGSWSAIINMINSRQFFSSGVLADGTVYAIGGEDSDAGSDTPLGELFDPTSNTWSQINKPAAFSWVAGDAAGSILADGRVLLSSLNTGRTAIWDPVTNNWIESGLGFGTLSVSSKTGNGNEETWTLLRDGTVMAIDISNNPQGTEIYNPATDLWTPVTTNPPNLALLTSTDGTTNPPTVYSPNELGPAILLYDGRLFAIGGNGQTGLYSAGTGWAAGPNFPANTLASQITPLMTDIDAPACLLPSGKVLCVAGNTDDEGGANPFWSNPTNFFEFDPTGGADSLTQLPSGSQPSTNGQDTWTARLLLLPTGQALYSSQGNTIALFTPDSADPAPQSGWKPVLTNYPSAMITGHSYQITGTQLNGLSQANSYGDDAQMATNYPIVQVTNTSNGKVLYLRSYNFSNFGITPGNVSSATIDIPNDLDAGSYSLVVIANGIASAAVTVTVATQDCYFILNQSSIAQGEIQALINLNGSPAVVDQVLFVVVEGFAASDLGLTSTASLSSPPNVPTIAPPNPKISLAFSGPVIPEDPTLPSTPQRFTFPFTIQFQDDSMFGTVPSLGLTAKITVKGKLLTANAIIDLIQSPNPYILHVDQSVGNPWYLSVDLKVFMLKQGQTKFAATVVSQSATVKAKDVATQYIQQVIANLNGGGASAYTEFDSLPDDEDTPTLAISPVDSSNVPVYNFALARVRLQDVNPANNVRLFFRMWQAQQTNASYNTTTTYPSTTNGAGQKISTLGIQGDEIMTIPFFATERVDTTTVSMATQTDTYNIRNITPDPLGGVTYAYYGCWLDINQPNDLWFPDRLVGGNPADIPFGPFTGMGTLLSIQQLVRSEHQCLLAEISYDLDPPIPATADPSTSDKLAQRNLAFVNVPNPGVADSRRVPQTFEIRPTPTILPAYAKPDELMILWGNVPGGSVAHVFLPAVLSAGILSLANRYYTSHRLTMEDAHTIQCPAEGVSYIPIPKGTAYSFAGLLTIDLPMGIKKGEEYQVVVNQVTTAGFDKAVGNQTFGANLTNELPTLIWRRVLGVFKLTIPVSTKALLLKPEERRLSVLRWIEKSIPIQSRWYLVFKRFVEQIAGKVQWMGGDPSQIIASSTGNIGILSGGGTGGGIGGSGEHGKERKCCTGKVTGLSFDRFGDFEGFLFLTEEGENRAFRSREHEIEELVDRAWEERMVITVFFEQDDPHCPVSIILRRIPRSL